MLGDSLLELLAECAMLHAGAMKERNLAADSFADHPPSGGSDIRPRDGSGRRTSRVSVPRPAVRPRACRTPPPPPPTCPRTPGARRSSAPLQRVQGGQAQPLGRRAHLLRGALAVPGADRAGLAGRHRGRARRPVTKFLTDTIASHRPRVRRRDVQGPDRVRHRRAAARPGSWPSSAWSPRCGRRPATSAPSPRPPTRSTRSRRAAPFWKKKPLQILVTFVCIMLVAITALALVAHRPAGQGGRRRASGSATRRSRCGSTPSGRSCWASCS